MIKAEGNRKRKCKHCETRIPAHEGFIVGVNFVCNAGCAYELALTALERNTKRQKTKAKQVQAKIEKDISKAHRERKKEVKPLKYWQDKLQHLVNQYVMQVRDKNQPCCTCGNPEANECGHWHSRGARPDIRYNLKNLAPQCHNCNVYKSGNKSEYDHYIKERWGECAFDKLNLQQSTLKEQFPHWTDYELEIKRYREILRNNGVTPRV